MVAFINFAPPLFFDVTAAQRGFSVLLAMTNCPKRPFLLLFSLLLQSASEEGGKGEGQPHWCRCPPTSMHHLSRVKGFPARCPSKLKKFLCVYKGGLTDALSCPSPSSRPLFPSRSD